MTVQAENLPGATPSKGTIRIAQVLSSSRGANSGLHLHPQGHRLVSTWCGHSSSVDFWAPDLSQHLQSFSLDVDLADIGAQIPPGLMPPGADPDPESWPAHIMPVVDSAMNLSGGHVALAAGRGVRVFRFSGDEGLLVPSQSLRGHEQSVTRVALDTGGERALSADNTGQIIVWSTVTARAQQILRVSTVPHTVGFIWNNMLAMCGDSQGRVICWELEQGRRHLQFQAHHGPVFRAAFNQDSGVLLSAGGDNTARMWNLEEGSQIGRDMRHRSAICDVCFAYAGRFVVTCGVDGHVAIWNSTDGDLLDWYFDSAPVYRLAFDKLNGTLYAAGARTVKVLGIDWQRLRELDADARSAGVLHVTAADHAALFSQPPPQAAPTYSGAAESAPIGSVMAARQTTDIPYPDRSSLVVPRGSAPAPARPGVGVSGPPRGPMPARPGGPGGPGSATMMGIPAAPSHGSTTSPGARAASMGTGAPFAVPPMPPGPRRVGAVGPATQVMPAFGDLATKPSLADAMASVQQRTAADEAAHRTTAYGIGKSTTVAADVGDANSFFNPVKPLATQNETSERMSRVESELIETEPRPDVPDSEPLTVVASDPAAAPKSVGARGAGARRQPPQKRAGSGGQSTIRRRVVIVALAMVTAALVARFGVFHYYTEIGFPSAVHTQALSVQSEFDLRVASVESEFNAYSAEEEANISTYRRSGTMTATEVERAVTRVERRIEQRRAQADQRVAEARAARDQRLTELDEERNRSAKTMANFGAIGAAVLSLLVSLLFVGRPKHRARR